MDTSPFRQAIWYYIHSIKGIRHDDYHYRRVSNNRIIIFQVQSLMSLSLSLSLVQVNQVLDITFKTYIRMVACFPEKVTNFDFRHNTQDLAYSEIVSLYLVSLEIIIVLCIVEPPLLSVE